MEKQKIVSHFNDKIFLFLDSFKKKGLWKNVNCFSIFASKTAHPSMKRKMVKKKSFKLALFSIESKPKLFVLLLTEIKHRQTFKKFI